MQVLPGMMGFLAYKAAALVQVYRDNEDLRLILPEEEDAGSDSIWYIQIRDYVNLVVDKYRTDRFTESCFSFEQKKKKITLGYPEIRLLTFWEGEKRGWIKKNSMLDRRNTFFFFGPWETIQAYSTVASSVGSKIAQQHVRSTMVCNSSQSIQQVGDCIEEFLQTTRWVFPTGRRPVTTWTA